MSAVPQDDWDRVVRADPPHEPTWQFRRGLTFHQAEELLDQLEHRGISQREMLLEADGVCVRWLTLGRG